MCDFISWIEKDGKLYYLTTEDIESKRGKEYRDYNPNADDIKGHGAIRWFYNLKGGKEKECTDFTTPKGFPREIQKAIIQGKFRRSFGPVPAGLLIAPLYADYEAKRAPLDADYKAKRDALYADYKAKRAPLYADYEAKIAPLYANYKAKIAPLYADYEAKRAPLYADYEAKRDALDLRTWLLVLEPKNRSKAWQ